MKFRDIVRILKKHGFALDRQQGSHRQYEGFVDGKRRIVTVAGKDGDDVPPGTLSSIGNQSGLPRRSFRQE